MRRRPAAALVAAAALASGVLAWVAWRGPSGAEGAAPGPYPLAPVIVISIDTLRADRLPAYGYSAGRTPALDALARESVLFEDVYSHVPLTLPAHASLFTGLLPPRHGVRDNGGFTLDAAHLTLAERFRGAGAETGGAVSSWVLRRATGIAQGFDWYEDAIETDEASASIGEQQRDGTVAVDRLAEWIAPRSERRFFAFLHLYEPHTPWEPPERHRGAATPYDGEVSYADELAGRFLDRLRTAGVLDRAVVVVTSDHGEGLGDHGEREHGLFLYREAVRVPLLVRLPGAAHGGTRVHGVVGHSDVAATLLDLAGLAHEGLDGVSQRAALSGGAVVERPVYSETLFPRYHFGWSELFAVTEGRLRYVEAPRPELFDLRSDPGERRNVVAERAAAATAMRAWVLERAGGAPPAPAEVPADVRERLAALGYVGATIPRAAGAGPAADPKDEIGAFEAFKSANELRRQGRDEEAAAALRVLLDGRPAMVDARETLGHTLFRMGRPEEALTELKRALESDPERGSAHLAIARIHFAAGRREAADRHGAAAVGRQPGEAYELLAQSALASGRVGEAEAFARHAVSSDPSRAVAYFVLGLAARARGRCEDALPNLRRAEEERARKRSFVIPGLLAATGECLVRLGREADAERAFQDELAAIPHSVEGRVGLAILYRAQGRAAEARSAAAGIVTAHPRPGADEYWTVLRTLRGLEDEAAARAWAHDARRRFPSDPRFR